MLKPITVLGGLGLILATAGVAITEYQRVKQKVDDIGTSRTPPGSQLVLTGAELNAYISGEIPHVVGQGAVVSSKLELGTDSGVMKARINFLRLQRNTGRKPGWLMQQILAGERDVEVAARVKSSGGTATIWVDRLEVAGIPLEGAALDFLMQVFIAPQFPNIRPGQPFPLRPGVDHFEVRPQAIRVFIKR